jgi:HEAT repeat protein
MQLLSHLGSLKHPTAAELAAPYLKDMDEGVRYTAAEALLRQKNEAVGREPLLELFTSDAEESLRIRIKIAEGFADLGWLVQGFRPGVEKKLPETFGLDREGHIKRKTTT